MAAGIGMAALFTGLFCTSEAAAIDHVTKGQSSDCVEIYTVLELMPQAVVFKTAKHKVVRMGTITDPVINLWMIVPVSEKIMGEGP